MVCILCFLWCPIWLNIEGGVVCLILSVSTNPVWSLLNIKDLTCLNQSIDNTWYWSTVLSYRANESDILGRVGTFNIRLLCLNSTRIYWWNKAVLRPKQRSAIRVLYQKPKNIVCSLCGCQLTISVLRRRERSQLESK